MFNGTKLRRRTVIDSVTAERIGYVSDIEIDELNGRISAVIIRRYSGWLSGVFKIGEMAVPWNAITAMSDEFVLVKPFDFGEKRLKNGD
ncbi:MAG: YlmC/YmxH family sporulation protein [Clostridia bacterium]|nr:YlmC/YmxH family sporulation protein [Clostridia bacterium]